MRMHARFRFLKTKEVDFKVKESDHQAEYQRFSPSPCRDHQSKGDAWHPLPADERGEARKGGGSVRLHSQQWHHHQINSQETLPRCARTRMLRRESRLH